MTTAMREICAVIRSGAWRRTLLALEAAGFGAVTRQRAYGRGKQGGLRYGDGPEGIRLLPKWVLTLVVEDHDVEAAVAAIMTANRTGAIGDGKIFICPLGQTISVRQEEHSSADMPLGALS
ncbi:MAG: P-II family nitrogen regulator [candidate division FCPU426 bacterium]